MIDVCGYTSCHVLCFLGCERYVGYLCAWVFLYVGGVLKSCRPLLYWDFFFFFFPTNKKKNLYATRIGVGRRTSGRRFCKVSSSHTYMYILCMRIHGTRKAISQQTRSGLRAGWRVLRSSFYIKNI